MRAGKRHSAVSGRMRAEEEIGVESGLRWVEDGDRWVLYDGDRELGWVGERLLGWAWLVRESEHGVRMGMTETRSDAMDTVQARAEALRSRGIAG